MTEHRVRIVEADLPGHPGFHWFAECSCGWSFAMPAKSLREIDAEVFAQVEDHCARVPS